MLRTELAAAVGTGKIQSGTSPGISAYVIEPAVPLGVPAAGILPTAPGTVIGPEVVAAEAEPVPAPAKAARAATARATPPMRTRPNPILALLAPSVGARSISLPSFSQFAADPSRDRRGALTVFESAEA
jgi:hypothetical protein